jgi:hypothetical protein
VSDPEAVGQLRQALGRQLAAMRNRAGLSQWELAPLTGYSRSTLSDAELGRHRLRREFWLRCDDLLNADSRLVEAYDRVEATAGAMRERALGTAQVARGRPTSAGLRSVQPRAPAVQPRAPVGSPRAPASAPDAVSPPSAPAASPVAGQTCPHCHRPVAVVIVPAVAAAGRG